MCGLSSMFPDSKFRVRHTDAQRRHSAGFTLLEMMVVLVIAGLLISLTVISISRNSRTDLHEEAQRLALLFESAGDEAQVRSQPIAWRPIKGGYQFDIHTENGWRPLRDDLLAPHTWQTEVTGVSINYAGSNESADRIIFGLESIDVPVTVTLYSPVGRVMVVGAGNGRYEVR